MNYETMLVDEIFKYLDNEIDGMGGLTGTDIMEQLNISAYETVKMLEEDDDILILERYLKSIIPEIEDKLQLRDTVKNRYDKLLDTGEYPHLCDKPFFVERVKILTERNRIKEENKRIKLNKAYGGKSLI